jgi:cytidylate kinase
MTIPVIAIDGTAASGKGTLAKRLAARLNYAVLDTGLLYRRVALSLIEKDISPDDHAAAVMAARALDPSTLGDPRLRGAEAGRGASVVAAIPEVREALDDFQRSFPSTCGKAGAILDGRDIGTVIFPDAPIKFYVDADVTIRAKRRHQELAAQGDAISYDTVLADMRARDARDGGRSFRPMMPAEDALMIDTTTLGPDAVFEMALAHMQEKA